MTSSTYSRHVRTEASSAMTRVLWQPFPGSPSRATSFPRVARFPYSRMFRAHTSFGILPEARLPSVSILPTCQSGSRCSGLFSGVIPGSVGALDGRIFNTNPSRTHRDAEPRLTNSEAL